MRFGCHLSIKNGFLGAAKQAYEMGAGAFQYFSKNPRSLGVKEFQLEDATLCKQFCEEKDILSVIHSPYPTTLTPKTNKKREAVLASLHNDLVIADACGSIGVVVHFGKQLEPEKPLQSYQLMIEILNEVLVGWDGQAKILLENTGGLPGTIGTTLDELAQVRNLCQEQEKIGFCFDTCHAFASSLWDGDNWQEVMERGNELAYFDHLEVIHLNNSKYATGTGKDRHAPIFNQGYILETQFNDILTTPQLRDIPFILETPKEEVPHEKEIAMLQEKW
ncbi:deoxyribonuclease IV [Virgibacillus soli]|uniref:Deoxyribonuclease IV n=1 Tax=Paracerasibacillus soli TaxID=480284 RepID=A0ABU5CUX1_9BACI|nr:deoxyribonuclease IV [Virgibacillus soli]MDY0409208.1 deoxyribonuclease IV [Virgibacillus soli]